MGEKVLNCVAEEISADLPFFSPALFGLTPKAREDVGTLCTNGLYLYFASDKCIRLFKNNPLFLRRTYLHTILHCIYGHLWLRRGRNRELYNLACDIAVEYIIDGLDKKSLNRVLSYIRQDFYSLMRERHIISPAGIYGLLLGENVEKSGNDTKSVNEKTSAAVRKFTDEELSALSLEFYGDDHSLWWDDSNKASETPQQKKAKEHWEEISSRVQHQRSRSDSGEDEAENTLASFAVANKKRRSYRDFLLKFARLREHAHVDDSEMDLAYYSYGLELYGNIPIIEPLETKEEKTLREFVIAVDTSYSTSGELVRRFLQETISILLESGIYGGDTVVHFLQCDEKIRDYVRISDIRMAENVIKNLKLSGGGNTDFRPVFTYTRRLQEEGRAGKVQGILYFTDGRGTYPEKMPDIKTAFIFMDKYDRKSVPAWALVHEAADIDITGEKDEHQ